MSHHHRRQQASNEKPELKVPEFDITSIQSFFEKKDLMLFSMIRPLLSPGGQKAVELLLDFCDPELKKAPLDLPGLIAQLNLKEENNPLKELLPVLISGMNTENKGGLNPALLGTLFSLLNNSKTQ